MYGTALVPYRIVECEIRLWAGRYGTAPVPYRNA
jgi:hypothetical protein